MQVLLIIMMAHHSFYGVKLGRSFDLKGIALVVVFAVLLDCMTVVV